MYVARALALEPWPPRRPTSRSRRSFRSRNSQSPAAARSPPLPQRATPAATHGAHTPPPLRSDAKVVAALLQLGSATEDTVAQEAQTFSALIKGQGLQSLHGAVSPPDS